MQNRFLILAAFLLAGFSSQARTWQTAGKGEWKYPATWIGGQVPPFSSSDTILIDHYVLIDQSITLHAGAFLRIDDSGGICGHRHLSLGQGTLLHIHGLLELDSLIVPGGHIYSTLSGNVILTYVARFSNGASTSSQGTHWIVGPWFECVKSIHDHPQLTIASAYGLPEVNVRRGGNGAIILHWPQPAPGGTFQLWDGNGKLLSQKSVSNEDEIINDIVSPPAGMYFWKLSTSNRAWRGKLGM